MRSPWGPSGGHLKAVLEKLVPCWAHLEAILGPSCAALGPPWGHLWPPWGRLGPILGPSWGHLVPSWGPPWPSGAVLGPSWGHLGAILAQIAPKLKTSIFLTFFHLFEAPKGPRSGPDGSNCALPCHFWSSRGPLLEPKTLPWTVFGHLMAFLEPSRARKSILAAQKGPQRARSSILAAPKGPAPSRLRAGPQSSQSSQRRPCLRKFVFRCVCVCVCVFVPAQ